VKKAVVILVLISCILLAGCTGVATTDKNSSGAAPTVPTHGFVLNESVRPGDDFFAYVNDAWIAEHPIPADKNSVSSFSELSDKVDNDLLALSLKAENTTSGDPDRNLTLIGQFFRSGMDTAMIDREGIVSLRRDLEMIDAISSRTGLTNATIVLLTEGSGPLYSYFAEVNPRNSTEMIPALYQGGLGLPDRDYYLRNDTKSQEIQAAYRAHITRVFVLMGEPDQQAAADAKTVYAMEKTLASSHFNSEENRIPKDTTNLYTLSPLEEQYPAIGWESLRTIPGSGPIRVVNIYQPRYVNGLNTMLQTAPLGLESLPAVQSCR
jgi:putative endopeptidase